MGQAGNIKHPALSFTRAGASPATTVFLIDADQNHIFAAIKQFIRFPGVLVPSIEPAEIIPVEPEQDNACAGKVVSFVGHTPFRNISFCSLAFSY